MSFRVFPAGNPSSSMPVFFSLSLLAIAKCEEEDVACGMWQVEFKRQAQLIARFNQNCIVVLGLYRTGDCCLLYVVCTAIWLPTGMRLVYTEPNAASVWNGFVTSGWGRGGGGGGGEGNEWNWVSMSLADLFNWKHFKSVEEMSFYLTQRRIWKITGDIGKLIELEIEKSKM